MKVELLLVASLAIIVSVEAGKSEAYDPGKANTSDKANMIIYTMPTCPETDPATPVYYPHEVYCYKFYECSDGTAYELDCAPPLNWNQAKKICDVNVDCGKLKPRNSTILYEINDI
ncbi:unnamed protein product [Acanthoscelides obtectus]|uniref:Chitin-binding type-2 domain-containing protein n=1 Tax=Acanthoscelides obtectus TaxID=200917 RepID=A0A9P0JS09_ACAOB|nr:unnamed protein product [Acanthoscelides obtectus]CAK1679313.1 hypothetical protein AOBTE_LOCUS32208 [Acanthoscelides obtectus]